MMYVFHEYEDVQQVYDGPDLDLEEREEWFEQKFYGIEPFQPTDNPCGITSWEDGPNGECSCPGRSCRIQHIAEWNQWNKTRHKKFSEGYERGVNIKFHEWLLDVYNFTPVEFKTVDT